MQFKEYLLEQLNIHPSMMPQDVAKMCYQAVFGADHLLQDIKKAESYFNDEYENILPDSTIPLYECISDDICRVNMAAWKFEGMPQRWLFNMFAETASVSIGSIALQREYLMEAEKLAEEGCFGFSIEEWNVFMKNYESKHMPPVHHSENYRDNEQPSYRIVKRRFVEILPILRKLWHAAVNSDELEPVIAALDGRAAAGKTTLAEHLKKIIDAEVIHMDDFFLPVNLRTPERLSQSGGNVHWERFAEEVIRHIGRGKPFSYGVFDCGKMDYNGEKNVRAAKFIIVEGSYSCHPKFGEYAHVKVFLDVDKVQQMERIIRRNGCEMAERFKTRWIPMEEKYFEEFKIKDKAHIKLI